MAATASGLFTGVWADYIDGSAQGKFDGVDDNKLQLLNTTAGVVPDFDADISPTDGSPTYDAGDPGTSGDYTGGGEPLAGESVTSASPVNTIAMKATDLVMTGTSLDVNAGIVFNETDTLDRMWCLLFFGQTQTTTGTLTIDFPTNGFVQIPHV